MTHQNSNLLIIERDPVGDVAVGLGMDDDRGVTGMRTIPRIVPATAHIKVKSLRDSCGEDVIDEITEGASLRGIGHAEFSVNAAQGSEEIAILVLRVCSTSRPLWINIS